MTVITTIEGLPVINAKKPIMLHVTPEDIKAARKHSPGNCAVAKACMREWKVKEVRVHLSRIYIRCNEKNWVRFATPSPMRNEIISYDRGGDFLPSVFTIKPVSLSQRTGKRQGTNTDKNDKSRTLRKKRKAYTVVKGVRVAAHK
jgi:hypothetical protein